MAKTKISEFSTTPGNNTDINGINIAEGCAPSGINNAIRELMSDLKEWQSGAMDVYVIPQGTAAAPGIQLYGDLDTGLYGDAANQLGVAVGGSSVGYFSSAGWVGNVVATTIDLTNIEVTNIKAKDGTASIALADTTGVATFSKPTVMSVDSASDALRITQIGAGNALLVEDSANPDTTPFVVTAAGLVGVGTLSPTRSIHVSAASGLPGITLESTSNGSSSNGVVVFNRTTTSTLTSQTIGSALWSHNLTDSTLVTAASIIVTGNNTAGSNTANMAIDAKTSTIMKVNGTEVANFASGGLNVTGTVDVTSIETTNIKAKDGTASASIADSTGVMTIASSVLTTTDINGGTIDGAVIGGSSAAAGTFTTATATTGNITTVNATTVDTTNIEVTNIKAKDGTASMSIADSTGAITASTLLNVDNLRLDGNTLSSTDTNGNIVVAPNGTGITTFNNYLKTGNLEVGQVALGTNLIKATNTNGGIYLQTNGTGLIFADAASIIAGNASATTKITTNGASDLVLDTNDGSNSGSITIQDGVNGNIVIAPNGTGQVQLSGALDVTDIEVTNIKAKDGTAALSIADSTGVVSVSANPVLSGGTANGVLYLNASKSATSGSALTFDGTTLGNTGGIVAGGSSPFYGSAGRGNVTSRGTSSAIFALGVNGVEAGYLFGTGLVVTLGAPTGVPITFDINGEKMRLTSGGQLNLGGNFTSTNNTLQVTGNAAIGYTTAAPTTGLIVAGNVGIGTDSPAARLDVRNGVAGEFVAVNALNTLGDVATATSSTIRLGITNSAGVSYATIKAAETSNDDYPSLVFGVQNIVTTNPAERMRINPSGTLILRQSSNAANTSVSFNTTVQNALTLDSSGNLGIGVTPSAWASTHKAIDIGANANISGSTSLNLWNNSFWNGSNTVYKNTDYATLYAQSNSGQHQWYTAPSGTAGNTISFTQALTLDANQNLLLNGTSAGASAVGTFAIFNGTAPTGSVTNGVILYAEDVSSSSELKVRDEAGNVTTLSPHNFSLIPEGPSEDMAWAYYSEKGGKRINVDMLKLARMVEKLTGEKLVYES